MRVSRAVISEVCSDLGALPILKRNFIPGMSMAVDRSLIDHLPVPPGWMHDHWLLAVAALREGVYISETPGLVLYRQHDGNVLGTQPKGFLARIRRAFGVRSYDYEAAMLRTSSVLALSQFSEEDWHLPRILLERLGLRLRFDAARYRAISGSPLAGVFGCVRLLASGDYSSFAANGRFDVVRDLARALRIVRSK
jgi:hypothetical protein